MNKFLIICAFMFAAPLAAQEHQHPAENQHPQHAGQNHRMGGGGGRMHSMIRHQYAMRVGIPESYEDLINPLTPDDTVLATGQRVYTENCSACHGVNGEGDGPAAVGLDPSPSNIRRLPRMPMMSSDAYLYWTIAEGGVPVGTAMPAFEQTLTSDEIWSVIQYLRNGFDD